MMIGIGTPNSQSRIPRPMAVTCNYNQHDIHNGSAGNRFRIQPCVFSAAVQPSRTAASAPQLFPRCARELPLQRRVFSQACNGCAT
jgi:hypothetical protein